MALMHSTMVPLGTPAHDFTLPDADGQQVALSDFADKPVLAVIFMCNHCPYVKAVLDRLIVLAREFESRGVQFVGINPNDAEKYPDDSPEAMRHLIRDKGLPFPYLVDATQEVARRYDAVCTPDIYVYGPDRRLAYRGRIDDNWQEPDKVTRRELKAALEALAAGDPAAEEQTPSMGCSIKWK